MVQVGNSFLDEYPDTWVLINNGRYLAVDLKPDEVLRLHRHAHACFGFCPLPEDKPVIETRSRTEERQPDAAMLPLVSAVSQAVSAAWRR